MRDLFSLIEETKDRFDTRVELSMVEIYNETIRDLLSDGFPAMPVHGLKLMENEKERVTIANVTIKTPTTADEVMDLVILGNERRSTSFTAANSQSSRSHAVLQINVTRSARRADVDFEREEISLDTNSATLSIVDLAGSERASATHNMGARMKEGAKINQSLLALSSCIGALCLAQRRGSRPHVPYRNSKLTRLLKFSLGGNCRTVMIVCVSPSSRDIEDTSNTLMWANKAKDVKTTVSRNVGGHQVSARQYLEKIAEYSERIKLLEAQLEKRDAELNGVRKLKQEEAQQRIRDAVRVITDRIENDIAAIKEGAEHRALWDIADLGVTYMGNRKDEIDVDEASMDPEAEKAQCMKVISQYKNAYVENRSVQAKVRREHELATGIEAQIQQTETRTFSGLDDVNIRNLHLELAAQRHRIAEAVSDARQRGYRTSAARLQDILARSIIALSRQDTMIRRYKDDIGALLTATAQQQPDLLSQIARRVTGAAEISSNELRAIVDSFGAMDSLPPRSPVKPIVPAALAALRSPDSSFSSLSPGSPRVKRLSRGHVAGKLSSPRKSAPRALRRSSLGPTTKPIRTARFAEDVDLETVHHFTQHTFDSSTNSVEMLDDSEDWEEVAETAKPIPESRLRVCSTPAPFTVSEDLPAAPAAPPPAPMPSLAPISTATAPAPKISSPRPPSSASSASTEPKASPMSDMPEWKKNRMLLGKSSMSNLNGAPSSPNTSVQDGSPMGRAMAGLGLGRPVRRGPLGELKQLPSLRASTASRLMEPTASSAARNKGAGETPSPAPAPEGRRLSMSVRNERRKLHKAAPYGRKSSLIPSPVHSPGTSPRGSLTGLSAKKSPPKSKTAMTLSLGPGAATAGLRKRPSVLLAASQIGNSSLPPWK